MKKKYNKRGEIQFPLIKQIHKKEFLDFLKENQNTNYLKYKDELNDTLNQINQHNNQFQFSQRPILKKKYRYQNRTLSKVNKIDKNSIKNLKLPIKEILKKQQTYYNEGKIKSDSDQKFFFRESKQQRNIYHKDKKLSQFSRSSSIKLENQQQSNIQQLVGKPSQFSKSSSILLENNYQMPQIMIQKLENPKMQQLSNSIQIQSANYIENYKNRDLKQNQLQVNNHNLKRLRSEHKKFQSHIQIENQQKPFVDVDSKAIQTAEQELNYDKVMRQIIKDQSKSQLQKLELFENKLKDQCARKIQNWIRQCNSYWNKFYKLSFGVHQKHTDFKKKVLKFKQLMSWKYQNTFRKKENLEILREINKRNRSFDKNFQALNTIQENNSFLKIVNNIELYKSNLSDDEQRNKYAHKKQYQEHPINYKQKPLHTSQFYKINILTQQQSNKRPKVSALMKQDSQSAKLKRKNITTQRKKQKQIQIQQYTLKEQFMLDVAFHSTLVTAKGLQTFTFLFENANSSIYFIELDQKKIVKISLILSHHLCILFVIPLFSYSQFKYKTSPASQSLKKYIENSFIQKEFESFKKNNQMILSYDIDKLKFMPLNERILFEQFCQQIVFLLNQIDIQTSSNCQFKRLELLYHSNQPSLNNSTHFQRNISEKKQQIQYKLKFFAEELVFYRSNFMKLVNTFIKKYKNREISIENDIKQLLLNQITKNNANIDQYKKKLVQKYMFSLECEHLNILQGIHRIYNFNSDIQQLFNEVQLMKFIKKLYKYFPLCSFPIICKQQLWICILECIISPTSQESLNSIIKLKKSKIKIELENHLRQQKLQENIQFRLKIQSINQNLFNQYQCSNRLSFGFCSFMKMAQVKNEITILLQLILKETENFVKEYIYNINDFILQNLQFQFIPSKLKQEKLGQKNYEFIAVFKQTGQDLSQANEAVSIKKKLKLFDKFEETNKKFVSIRNIETINLSKNQVKQYQIKPQLFESQKSHSPGSPRSPRSAFRKATRQTNILAQAIKVLTQTQSQIHPQPQRQLIKIQQQILYFSNQSNKKMAQRQFLQIIRVENNQLSIYSSFLKQLYFATAPDKIMQLINARIQKQVKGMNLFYLLKCNLYHQQYREGNKFQNYQKALNDLLTHKQQIQENVFQSFMAQNYNIFQEFNYLVTNSFIDSLKYDSNTFEQYNNKELINILNCSNLNFFFINFILQNYQKPITIFDILKINNYIGFCYLSYNIYLPKNKVLAAQFSFLKFEFYPKVDSCGQKFQKHLFQLSFQDMGIQGAEIENFLSNNNKQDLIKLINAFLKNSTEFKKSPLGYKKIFLKYEKQEVPFFYCNQIQLTSILNSESIQHYSKSINLKGASDAVFIQNFHQKNIQFYQCKEIGVKYYIQLEWNLIKIFENLFSKQTNNLIFIQNQSERGMQYQDSFLIELYNIKSGRSFIAFLTQLELNLLRQQYCGNLSKKLFYKAFINNTEILADNQQHFKIKFQNFIKLLREVIRKDELIISDNSFLQIVIYLQRKRKLNSKSQEKSQANLNQCIQEIKESTQRNFEFVIRIQLVQNKTYKFLNYKVNVQTLVKKFQQEIRDQNDENINQSNLKQIAKYASFLIKQKILIEKQLNTQIMTQLFQDDPKLHETTKKNLKEIRTIYQSILPLASKILMILQYCKRIQKFTIFFYFQSECMLKIINITLKQVEQHIIPLIKPLLKKRKYLIIGEMLQKYYQIQLFQIL